MLAGASARWFVGLLVHGLVELLVRLLVGRSGGRPAAGGSFDGQLGCWCRWLFGCVDGWVGR